MKTFDKIYIPVPVEETTENGVVLIATGKVTVSNEGAKIEFIQQHLKEQDDMIVFSKEEFTSFLSIITKRNLSDEVIKFINDKGYKGFFDFAALEGMPIFKKLNND